jgi:hypothetical protein
MFLMDILIIFNTAYYNEDFKLIEDRKNIAKDYLTGWFAIDLVAIVPFDLFFQTGLNTSMVRIARVGRLYKLVKLTRLIRVFKVMKFTKKMQKDKHKEDKNLGFERLIFFTFIFLLLTHIVACLWIMIP